MIFETLETPQTVDLPFGQVQATVRAWGRTEQPWNDPPLVSYSVLGNYNAEGRFVAIPGTEEVVQIDRSEWNRLRSPNDRGKRQDQYRNDDIVEMHRSKLANRTD